jgi:hypothetical protein
LEVLDTFHKVREVGSIRIRLKLHQSKILALQEERFALPLLRGRLNFLDDGDGDVAIAFVVKIRYFSFQLVLDLAEMGDEEDAVVCENDQSEDGTLILAEVEIVNISNLFVDDFSFD